MFTTLSMWFFLQQNLQIYYLQINCYLQNIGFNIFWWYKKTKLMEEKLSHGNY